MSTGVVLCVGEALIAFTPVDGRGLEVADDLLVAVGGAEVNVAVALARSGVPARLGGRVGDDPFGRRTLATVRAAGVDTRFVEVDPVRPTGVYFKDPTGPVRYYRHGSAGAAHRTLAAAALAGVDHIHLTGITPALSDDCRHLVESLLAVEGVTKSFDINYRPALWNSTLAAPALHTLAARADLVFTGQDEAQTLWGAATPDAVRALFPEVPELVVKDGPHHATAFHHHDRITIPAPRIDIVEPIGAGDAFAAGYLTARRRHEPLPAALRSGHLHAAIVLGSHNDHAHPPSPREQEIARTGHGWPDALGC